MLHLTIFLATFLLGATPDGRDLERPWTVLIYGAADNDADGHMFRFLNDIRRNVADDPGMELVLFMDRHEDHSTDATTLGEDFTGARLYHVTRDGAERLAGGDEFPEMTLEDEYEADSADPENLRKFIAFAKARFPARRYALLIYGHADGRAMCPDDESGREMGIAELTHVVGEDESVDLMALELCNMGGIEIAYQWRPGNGGFSTDVLVAIPNAGPPLDWGRVFARLRTPGHPDAGENTFDPATVDAAQFGRLVIEEGGKGRLEAAAGENAERARFEAVAAYDLEVAEEVKLAVDELARAVVQTDSRRVFEGLRGRVGEGCAMNYARGRIDVMPYVDLYDLCRRTAACEDLPDAVRERAAVTMAALDEFVLDSFGMSGYENFVAGENGVFIVFPDGDAASGQPLSSETAWATHCWYTPLEGLDPIDYGQWAWCADGAEPGDGVVDNWFEMLDSWYDDPSQPGGHNGYQH